MTSFVQISSWSYSTNEGVDDDGDVIVDVNNAYFVDPQSGSALVVRMENGQVEDAVAYKKGDWKLELLGNDRWGDSGVASRQEGDPDGFLEWAANSFASDPVEEEAKRVARQYWNIPTAA